MSELLKHLTTLYGNSTEMIPGIWPAPEGKIRKGNIVSDSFSHFFDEDDALELMLTKVLLKDVCGEKLNDRELRTLYSWQEKSRDRALDWRVLTQIPYKDITAMVIHKLIARNKCTGISRIFRSTKSYFGDLNYQLRYWACSGDTGLEGLPDRISDLIIKKYFNRIKEKENRELNEWRNEYPWNEFYTRFIFRREVIMVIATKISGQRTTNHKGENSLPVHETYN